MSRSWPAGLPPGFSRWQRLPGACLGGLSDFRELHLLPLHLAGRTSSAQTSAGRSLASKVREVAAACTAGNSLPRPLDFSLGRNYFVCICLPDLIGEGNSCWPCTWFVCGSVHLCLVCLLLQLWTHPAVLDLFCKRLLMFSP